MFNYLNSKLRVFDNIYVQIIITKLFNIDTISIIY